MARVTIEVEDQLLEKITTLAHDMGRTLDEVVAFALKDFYPEERDIMDSIMAGDRDIAEGRVVPHEAVEAWVKSLSTDNPLPLPQSNTLERAS